MHILHICSHKWPIPSPAIFIPTIYEALRSRFVSHCESDRTIYAVENIGLIILKRPLRGPGEGLGIAKEVFQVASGGPVELIKEGSGDVIFLSNLPEFDS